jgi:hypothetical protein
MVIGLAIPVLPLHVHDDLGMSTFFVGLAAGSQFTASLLSRLWAGHYADIRNEGEAHAARQGEDDQRAAWPRNEV